MYLVWTAIISAVVSGAVSYFFKHQIIRRSAEIQFEFEERKRLRKLIGRHHGRLLHAANSMNYRMWNLYSNHHRGWLSVSCRYKDAGYYFRSTVYRFLDVCSRVRLVEREALLLDGRIANRKDFAFLNYVAAIHWVMTDVALVKGLDYDDFDQTDHFFSDTFRGYCDSCLDDSEFLEIEEFEKYCNADSQIAPVLGYFDGLLKDESRLRWDRLVAFHLLLMAFVNAFGYERQYSSRERFEQVSRQMCNHEVLENLVAWLPRHGLGRDSEARKILQLAFEA